MFSSLTLGSSRSPVTVVGVTSDGKTVPAGHAKVQAVLDALETPGFAADNGEIVAAGAKHVLLGLGDPALLTAATVRVAASTAHLCKLLP